METIPLSKDTWVHIAYFLNKNDIACLKSSCNALNKWLQNHPRLAVDNIPYMFWLLEELMDDETGGCYGGYDFCVFIESIDRGVMSFTYFAKALKEAYPNIKELDFKQNYSHSGNIDIYGKLWEKDFIFFIRYLGLTYLKIEDSQSSFFKHFNWDKILDAMPDRSEYILLCDRMDCDCFDCNANYKDIIDNQCFKIKTKGTKRLVIHGENLISVVSI
jgi:hypothetical protein